MLVHLPKYPLTYMCAMLNSKTAVCIYQCGVWTGNGSGEFRSERECSPSCTACTCDPCRPPMNHQAPSFHMHRLTSDEFHQPPILIMSTIIIYITIHCSVWLVYIQAMQYYATFLQDCFNWCSNCACITMHDCMCMPLSYHLFQCQLYTSSCIVFSDTCTMMLQ